MCIEYGLWALFVLTATSPVALSALALPPSILSTRESFDCGNASTAGRTNARPKEIAETFIVNGEHEQRSLV